jgi:hypothetical protein
MRTCQIHYQTSISVFSTVLKSPWQHGTNEYTNGLLASIFPKGLISRAGTPKTSKHSSMHSTVDPGKNSDERPQQKYPANNYYYSNKLVLQRRSNADNFEAGISPPNSPNMLCVAPWDELTMLMIAATGSFFALLQRNVLSKKRGWIGTSYASKLFTGSKLSTNGTGVQ